MTAAKRPAGAPTWISRGHSLSDNARAALIDALGFPANSQDNKLFLCLQRVEHWLGFYAGGVNAIDNAPSTAVYVRELEAVKKAALQLMTLLNSPDHGINPWTRDTLSAHFVEMGSISGPDGFAKATVGAGNLAGACHSALKALEVEKKCAQEKKKTDTGRKKAGAREHVLKMLLELYGDYSKRHFEKRERKGAIVPLSEFEKHELRFVRSAFNDIGKDTFQDAHGDQKWLELIRPIRQASAKMRMRASQAIEPRHRKKAKRLP